MADMFNIRYKDMKSDKPSHHKEKISGGYQVGPWESPDMAGFQSCAELFVGLCGLFFRFVKDGGRRVSGAVNKDGSASRLGLAPPALGITSTWLRKETGRNQLAVAKATATKVVGLRLPCMTYLHPVRTAYNCRVGALGGAAQVGTPPEEPASN